MAAIVGYRGLGGRKRGYESEEGEQQRASKRRRSPSPRSFRARDCPKIVDFGEEMPFEKLSKLGEGTYGVVYKSRHTRSGRLVALKKVHLELDGDGVPGTAEREIGLLRELDHPNVIRLEDVYAVATTRLYVVFELMELDLSDYIREVGRVPLPPALFKSLLWQLCRGVQYLHSRQVIHRDLKPQNLLLSRADGTLKIADFGLSRRFSFARRAYTPEVVTLWYRCPELLLGDTCYCPALDMWSVGLIFAEMVTGRPLLPGESEIHQLFLIFQLLGTPNEQIWPGSTLLPYFNQAFPRWNPKDIAVLFPNLNSAGLDLLFQSLRYDKNIRLTAKDAVAHSFFTDVQPNAPLLPQPSLLPANDPKRRLNPATPATPWDL